MMCHTSYKRYRNCECIYIRANPVCCPTFTSHHPENHFSPPFKPRLLTWTREGLDMDLNSTNFMSADVNDERAPKGLTCPTITAVPDHEPAVESCPLCANPYTLGIVQKKQIEGQSNVAEKSAGKAA